MNPFNELEPWLIKAIPGAIGSLQLAKPICAVRLYYYDTHAPFGYIRLRAVLAEDRDQVVSSQGDDVPFYLWASGEECGDVVVDLPSEPPISQLQNEIKPLLQSVYELLGVDEDKYMPQYRKMLQKVAQQLNAIDWSEVCSVTDDFVVIPADGEQFFGDDYRDIVQSVPKEKLELLRSRKFLGKGNNWDSLAGRRLSPAEMAIKTIEANAAKLPVPNQIEFWIMHLDQLAGGGDCELKRIGVNEHFPLENLGNLGPVVVIPLLELANKWANSSEWDFTEANKPKLRSLTNVVVHLLWKVKEIRCATSEVEVLLRQILEKSCRVNEGQKIWGLIPFHTADSLHELFGRYPKPKMAGNNALVDHEPFLNVPLG